MLNMKYLVATCATLALILPFAAGLVHAAEPATADRPVSQPILPPTIDTDKDGKADAWDRDANGLVDAWDTNGDNKPDLFDDNGDGKPDGDKAPPPPSEKDGELGN